MDIDGLRNVYSRSFSDSRGYEEYFFTKLISRAHVATAFRDGKTVSCAFAFDGFMKLYSSKLKYTYITGAATLPEYRGRGIFAEVMEELLSDARDRGVAVAALYPSVKGYYERLGFAGGGCIRRGRATYRYRAAEEEDAGVFAEIYAKYTADLDCVPLRSSEDFSDLIASAYADGAECRTILSGGKVTGYHIFDRDCELNEFACDGGVEFGKGDEIWTPARVGEPFSLVRVLNPKAVAEAVCGFVDIGAATVIDKILRADVAVGDRRSADRQIDIADFAEDIFGKGTLFATTRKY